MLQTGRAAWPERVGIESGKPPAPADIPTGGEKPVLSSRSSLLQYGNPPDTSPPIHESNGVHNSSIPLKRSREERDRTRTLPREPSSRAPMSPPNLRQAFLPDQGHHWSPNRDNVLDNGSLSPGTTRRRDRGDRWVPPPRRSPPPRKSSPPRRPSPVRTGSSELAPWPRALPKSSPTRASRRSIDKHDIDARELATFRKLTWKAPEMDLRPHSDSFMPKSQNITVNGAPASPEQRIGRHSGSATHVKVDFNGLKGVPTGPKRAAAMQSLERAKLPNRTLPPVEIAVRHAPHIFISAEYLPAHVSMTKHLHGFLKRYITRELDVCVDESGWYLCFEDTVGGRDRLELCYNNHNGAKLFSMYTMHMERFLDGQPKPALELHTNVNGVSPLSNVNSPGVRLSAEAVPDAHTSVDGRNISLQSNVRTEGKASTDSRIEIPGVESNVNEIINFSSPAEVASHHLRNSSPLRVPSRQDKDETSSSISGITGSDMSVSKRLKCHVCQANTHLDTEILVQCSSCPRRYHRRCHLHPAIPSNLDLDHSWQCRRCVKKKIQSESRLSNAYSAAGFSPAASVGQPEQPPPKRPRLDVSQASLPLNSTVTVNGLSVASIYGTKEATLDHQSGQNELVADAGEDYEPVEQRSLNSDEKNLSEANDLVAQSFASPKVQTGSAQSTLKSGKLNLVRKKIARPEQGTTSKFVDSPKLTATSLRSAAPSAVEQVDSDTSTYALDLDNSRQNRFAESTQKSTGDDSPAKNIVDTSKDSFLPERPPDFEPSTNTPSNVPKVQSTIESVAPTVVQSWIGSHILNTEVHASATDKAYTELRDRHTINGAKKLISSTEKTPGPRRSLEYQPGIAAQRMKPGNTQLAQCVKCLKKIAYLPSRTNTLCSRCKTEASVDSTSRSAPSVSDIVEDRVEKHIYVSESATELIEREYGSETLLSKTKLYTPMIGEQSEEILRSTDANFKLTRPRTSCEKCRKNRKRCTHHASSTSQEEDSSGASAYATIVEKHGEDRGSEGDLDFWTAKSVSKLTNGEISHNAPLPDRALGNDVETAASMNVLLDNEEGSRSQSPNEAPSRSAPGSVQAKRQSQTRPAYGAYDLGDSFTRPPNTYVKLIGMALCSAPDHRLKGNDIVQWVIKNIPSYKAGVGKWENSLRATMTLKRAGYGGNEGLWKIVDDGSKKNQGFMYELLPGKAENMLHWDPVLRQPVSPPKGWRIEQNEHAGHAGAGKRRQHSPSDESPESPIKPPNRRRRQRQERGDKRRSPSSGQDRTRLHFHDESFPLEFQNGRPIEGFDDSSDDASLPPVKRKPTGVRTATLNGSGVDSAVKDVDVMSIEQPGDENRSATIQPLISAPTGAIAGNRSVALTASSKPTLEELIEVDARNTHYFAKSLFDEWPEYDPENEFNREAKIAEIKRRPTRKQRFGKQDTGVEMETEGPVSRYVFSENSLSPERSKRINRSGPYPWEAGEENVIQCDTIEEVFNLPSNPIAIIHNGELAYRDSFKNTRVVYKTGYV